MRPLLPSGGARFLAAAACGLALLTGCATVRELTALRFVDFEFDRVSDVRVAGVRLREGMKFSDLAAGDLARLLAAASVNQVPLELVAHVRARNPAENRVTARLVALDWRFFLEERPLMNGAVEGDYPMPPGADVDVPVAVRFDLAEMFDGGASDLLETALAIAGYGGRARELRLELDPTVQTGIGPIRYPAPIVVRRPAD